MYYRPKRCWTAPSNSSPTCQEIKRLSLVRGSGLDPTPSALEEAFLRCWGQGVSSTDQKSHWHFRSVSQGPGLRLQSPVGYLPEAHELHVATLLKTRHPRLRDARSLPEAAWLGRDSPGMRYTPVRLTTKPLFLTCRTRARPLRPHRAGLKFQLCPSGVILGMSRGPPEDPM